MVERKSVKFKIEDIPRLSELITTMNANPIGAALFIAVLSILLTGLALLASLYLHILQ